MPAKAPRLDECIEMLRSPDSSTFEEDYHWLKGRIDFALFMVEALENDALVHEAPAIVGCRTPSAKVHAATGADSSTGLRS